MPAKSRDSWNALWHLRKPSEAASGAYLLGYNLLLNLATQSGWDLSIPAVMLLVLIGAYYLTYHLMRGEEDWEKSPVGRYLTFFLEVPMTLWALSMLGVAFVLTLKIGKVILIDTLQMVVI